MDSPIHASLPDDTDSLVSPLQEVLHKTQASLMVQVEQHTKSQEYSFTQDGLDFLDTKNSLLLSYMIDLVYRFRSRLLHSDETTAEEEDCYTRLMEMKTILDKISSGLDRKLRYQLDKILLQAASHRSSEFASTGAGSDPLQFRPSIQDDDDRGRSSSEEEGEPYDNSTTDPSHPREKEDDDLAAARQTMFLAKQKHPPPAASGTEEADAALYRAPRLVATPYPLPDDDAVSRRMERSEQRLRQKLRASEMIQTLKQHVVGAEDHPEQEDTTGGTAMGRQSEASRRFLRQQNERTKHEEEYMIRFTTTKKEKKEQRRLMREEQSNLSSLADLTHLVRDSSLLQRRPTEKKRPSEEVDPAPRRSRAPRNALQAELFASGEDRRKKKSHRSSK